MTVVICGNKVANVNAESCETYSTCAKCVKTATDACSWSMEKQSCHGVGNGSDTEPRSCPTFRTSYEKTQNSSIVVYTVKVKISDDERHFTELLRTRYVEDLACHLDELRDTKPQLVDSEIVCRFEKRLAAEYPANKSAAVTPKINYFTVEFGGVHLQFDDKRNNYIISWNGDDACHDNSTEAANQRNCISCFWEDNLYMIYGEWCSVPKLSQCSGVKAFRNYDVRDRNDSLHRTAQIPPRSLIRLRCPTAVRIESVEPTHGILTGGTVVKVTVKNHRILVDDRIIRVTVAGRLCKQPESVEDTITCKVSDGTKKNSEGPVEVNYIPLRGPYEPFLMVQSEQVFQFVDPLVTDVSPTCGPMVGGAVVRIQGQFPAATATATVRVFMGEHVDCVVTKRDEHQIVCVTGPSEANSRHVRLVFGDGGREFDLETDFEYSYVNGSTVDADQHFEGIVSGGTQMAVHGRYFECVANASVYVMVKDHPDTRYTGPCTVNNSTFMVCRSPAIPGSYPNASNMLIGLQGDFTDANTVNLIAIPDTLGYMLFPDPEVKSFMYNNSSTVIVSGKHLDRGYLAGDLSIRSADLADGRGPCNVTSVQSHQIVCQLPVGWWPNDWWSVMSNKATNDDQLIVAFGNKLSYRVKSSQSAIVVHSKMPFTPFLFGLLAVLTAVCLFIAFVMVTGVYCLKAARKSRNGPTEMELLCNTSIRSNIAMAQ